MRSQGTGRTIFLMVGLLIAAAMPRASEARVTRFVVEQRRLFNNGSSWGSAGPYERLDGTAYMEVDPRDPLNAVIVNLDKAPRNGRGMVEFSAPFFILKPMDMLRGNHKIYYAINNRGNKSGLLSLPPAVTLPSTNNPLFYDGDGLQLRLGYTIVDAGWQGDVAEGNDRLFPSFPVPTQPDGSPIVSNIRIEYSDRTIPQEGTFTLNMEGNSAFVPYETADMDTAHSTLTVRDDVNAVRVSITPDRWAFGTCPDGPLSLQATTTDICLFDGFQADKIYELIYPAKNPMVMGLAYAVTRDIDSFLRYELQDDAGNRNPLALTSKLVGILRSYGFGGSSTGMYLREFLYLGFNEDEAHRKVFDAIHLTIPGTHRLFANVEFADPNTYSRQDDRHDFLSTSTAPLTFGVTTDPITGIHDGILKRPETDPLVFQTISANEFWNMRGSLEVADGLGNPIQVPDNVRLYFHSSFSHVGGVGLFSPPSPPLAVGSTASCQHLTNSGATSPTMRAMLIALDAWADQGVAPPPSNYPRVEEGTLVTLKEASAAFPNIPGVSFPTVLNGLDVLNFGPEFSSVGGRLTVLPPLVGPSYKMFVPKSDQDGLDLAGVRTVDIRAPLGTNVGWALRVAGSRAPNLCALSGSYIPFAQTMAERLASGDPRPSLEERYGNHTGFVRAVRRATRELVRERLLLEEDANTFVNAARSSNVLMGAQQPGPDGESEEGAEAQQ